VNAEFNWWLLIVGVVVGAGLCWLVVADSRRRDEEISEAETTAEATWIAETLHGSANPVGEETALAILRLHRSYLATSLPPDDEADSRAPNGDAPSGDSA
jgi:hypothetical protein